MPLRAAAGGYVAPSRLTFVDNDAGSRGGQAGEGSPRRSDDGDESATDDEHGGERPPPPRTPLYRLFRQFEAERIKPIFGGRGARLT